MEETQEYFFSIFLYDSYETYIYIVWVQDEEDLESYSNYQDYILLSKQKFPTETEAEAFLRKFLGRKELDTKVQAAIESHFSIDTPDLEYCLDKVAEELFL